MVLLLVENGNVLGAKKMEAEDFFTGMTLELVQAAVRGNADAVATMVKTGADPNALGKEDMTPLVWSAFFAKDKRSIVILLRNGADPNLRVRKNLTPMLLSLKEKDTDYLRIFLDHGGNPNLYDVALGETPLILETTNEGAWAHMKLLLDWGVDIDTRGTVDNTLIYEASLLRRFDQVFYLLNRGANYQIKTSSGDSALNRIFNMKVDLLSELSGWQKKCQEWLEARGVKNPGTGKKSPEELNKFLNDISESAKKNKHKNTP